MTDLTDLTVTMLARMAWTATKTGNMADTATSVYTRTQTEALTFGTADGQADQIFCDRRTLAGAASEDLDLAGGVTNRFGTTCTFARIKGVLIMNRSDEQAVPTTASLTIGGATHECQLWFGAAGDKETLPAGGTSMHMDPGTGWAVTAATADDLKVLNNAAAAVAEYDIVIVGESA